MIGVYDVLTWLKRSAVYHELFHHGYCGKLDNKQPMSLGVYPLKRGDTPYRAYGGLESYDRVGISLLIHYTKNVEESQYAACKLFEYLRAPFPRSDNMLISDTSLDAAYPEEDVPACPVHYPDINTEHARRIVYIDVMVPEPVSVGTDDSGVFEFVIEFQIYVKKEIENHA